MKIKIRSSVRTDGMFHHYEPAEVWIDDVLQTDLVRATVCIDVNDAVKVVLEVLPTELDVELDEPAHKRVLLVKE